MQNFLARVIFDFDALLQHDRFIVIQIGTFPGDRFIFEEAG
jgi:hypothetical protein